MAKKTVLTLAVPIAGPVTTELVMERVDINLREGYVLVSTRTNLGVATERVWRGAEAEAFLQKYQLDSISTAFLSEAMADKPEFAGVISVVEDAITKESA
jgi:hypothetical protein